MNDYKDMLADLDPKLKLLLTNTEDMKIKDYEVDINDILKNENLLTSDKSKTKDRWKRAIVKTIDSIQTK